MKKIFLFLLINLIPYYVFSFDIKLLLQHFAQNDYTNNPIRTCIDNENNIIVASTFSGTVDFDLSYKTYNLSSNNNPYSNFLAKYSAYGELIFAVNFNSTESNKITSVKTDQKNNIYLLGDYSGTIDLDPGSGSNVFTATPNSINNPEVDIFMSKFSASGRFLWGKSFGNLDWDASDEIEVDKKGNIYFTATFRGALNIGSISINAGNSGRNPYLVKLNSKGDALWVRHISASNQILSNDTKNSSIFIDDSLNVYTTGNALTWVIFNFNASDSFSYFSNPYYETHVYFQKLDSSGNIKFGKVFAGRTFTLSNYFISKGISIVLDKKNDIYIGGYFSNKVDFNPSKKDSLIIKSKNNSNDAFLAKLNQKGELIWVKTFGGEFNERVKSVYISKNNKINILGDFTGNFYYKKSINDSILFSSNGNSGIFFITLDSNGNYEYSNYFSQLNTNIRLANAFDIILNNKQNYYITGFFSDSTNINTNNQNNKIAPGGNFFIKINSCSSTYDTLNISTCDLNYTSPSKKHKWTSSGTYYDTISNYLECDSILKITLKIIPKTTSTLNIKICNGFYTTPSGKNTYKNSGIYYDYLKNYFGCDSIIKINLQIDTSTFSILNINSCTNYNSPSNKYIYTNNGIYYDTIINYKGCDSIIKINFKKHNPSFSNLNINSCFNLQSPSKKYIWTKTGIYKDTIDNFFGCDSFMTINLKIYTNKLDTVNLNFCNSMKSPARFKIWKKPGIYLDTFLNYYYCDSIVAYNLISSKTYSNININSCNSYSLSRGKKITESGIYFDSIPNYLSCDSVIKFDITITKINSDVNLIDSFLISEEEFGDNYYWIDCNTSSIINTKNDRKFLPSYNGNFKVIINKNNCKDTSECTNFNQLSTYTSLLNKIKIYPSPAYNFLNIDASNYLNVSKINLYNCVNQLIYSENISNNLIKLDLNYNSGIYFIELVSTKNESIFYKFIISK